MPPSFLRTLWGVILCGVALLAGCYMPEPAPHAQLQVPDAEHLRLDGQDIALAALPEALAQRLREQPRLVLELHVTARTDEALVMKVVAAAKGAGLPVAFVNDELACSASSPSGACSG